MLQGDDTTPTSEWLKVKSLDLEAQGVAHSHEGKVVFVEGALAGEEVQVQVHQRKKNWERATITALRAESSQRVQPACRHFGHCGGCNMQHLHIGAQVATKQRALEDALWHLGKLKAQIWLRPIEGPTWGYRYRARLSVVYVKKAGTVWVGFRERQSSQVADMDSCEVLPPKVSQLLLPLRQLLNGMALRDRAPQIEVAVGAHTTALVLRHLGPVSDSDRARLRQFAQTHAVQWWLQSKGPDTVCPLDPADTQLDYTLPEFGITMPFRPTDFTQVNPHINRVMVAKAVQLLHVQPHELVIDWFCGLGNFTLPLATLAQTVLGVEGSSTLVERATHNARLNHLSHKTSFALSNLFNITPEQLRQHGTAQKWLIDPPREGAFALIKALVELSLDPAKVSNYQLPQRIVYVSCNPATLARDAALLVHQAGYRCTAAGAINMFPHTAHVESMAVFERT
jgi:23S rRNA (uracil1939-C5)-methyltransferase